MNIAFFDSGLGGLNVLNNQNKKGKITFYLSGVKETKERVKKLKELL